MIFGDMSIIDSMLMFWSVSWNSRVDFKRKHTQDYYTHMHACIHTHTFAKAAMW